MTKIERFWSLALRAIAAALTLVSALAIVFGLTLLSSSAAQAQTFSVIYDFTNSPMDGGLPEAGLTLRGGSLYGTTWNGGNGGFGTVYEITHVGSDWVTMPIFIFQGHMSGGAYLASRVVFGPDGHLYGATYFGGDCHNGVVFDLIPPLSTCYTAACLWTENVLHPFACSPSDGATPTGDLFINQQGDIYGTTLGVAGSAGTVYQMTKSENTWAETPIYKFSGYDGRAPEGGVILDDQGNLFGTTPEGGLYNSGTIFKLTNVPGVGWQETVLYSFQDGSDGGFPVAGLVFDKSGNLYGATTDAYGGYNGGTVFELSPSGDTWTYNVLWNLYYGSGGCGPHATLSMDPAGNLYGTTTCDGAFGMGSVFELINTPNGWLYNTLHNFTGGSDEAIPFSYVSIDTDGTLYGTARQGGAHNSGVVWMIKP